MADSDVGQFGHHPDPAIDFCVEVREIEAQAWNYQYGFDAPTLWQLNNRIRSAMDFRFVTTDTAVRAKDRLREIEKQLNAASTSSVSLDEIVGVLEGLLGAETVPHHVGYDSGAGGGNYVYEDAVLTTNDAFVAIRSLLHRLKAQTEDNKEGV
jgi:hypothetical protein